MQPVMAAFSRISDHRERLQSAFLKASQFTMMIAVPACVGISLTSDMIVKVLLGPKWNEAAVYLPWLALSIVLSPYYQNLYSLALAMNRPSVIFRLSFIELCSRIVLVSSGLYFLSLMGAIGARGAASLILFISSLWYARMLIDVSVWTQLSNLWKIAAACTVMALFVLLLRFDLDGRSVNIILELGLTAAFGALVYVCTLYVFGLRLRGYIARSTEAAF
jgi:PST family polysaccharide transporter